MLPLQVDVDVLRMMCVIKAEVGQMQKACVVCAPRRQRQQGKILRHVETHGNALLHGTHFNLCRFGDDKREEEDASRGSKNLGSAPTC